MTLSSLFSGAKYTHIKTGNTYMITGFSTFSSDCELDGKMIVEYNRVPAQVPSFSTPADRFRVKFTEWKEYGNTGQSAQELITEGKELLAEARALNAAIIHSDDEEMGCPSGGMFGD